MSTLPRRTPTVGFVTTCKGRLHHLKQTLPMILADGPDEVVVVDYNCPQGTGNWVLDNHPSVKVVFANEERAFRVSRARNLGLMQCSTDWVVMIDADIMVQPGLVAWLRNRVEENRFYRHAPVDGQRDRETWGTFACSRIGLSRVGGFDEVIDGWGGEDDDIYHRLTSTGIFQDHFPARYLTPISHGDDERLALYAVKDRRYHHAMNQMYLDAKKVFAVFLRSETELPVALRQNIRRAIRTALAQPGEGLPKVRLNVSANRWLPKPYRLTSNLVIEFEMALADGQAGERPDQGSTANRSMAAIGSAAGG